jgi:uncharacterized tellurite resistance protein B-like protein
MSNPHERHVALLEVLAAAAWADGRLDPEEARAIQARMAALGLSAEDAGRVARLLEHPVSYARAEELTRDLLVHLRTPEERRDALAQVERLLRADGELGPAEKELLAGLSGVMGSLDSVDTFLGWVAGVFRGMFATRAAGGEGEVTRHLKNAVLARLHAISGGAWRSEVDHDSLNRYTLFGAVLGRIAEAHGGLSPEELARIRGILEQTFFLKPPLLDWVMQAIVETRATETSRQGLLSEYNRIASMEERQELLDAAFAVAVADDRVDRAELEELRLLSNFLWIDPRDFHRIRARWGVSAS